jgi:hypothetical protein
VGPEDQGPRDPSLSRRHRRSHAASGTASGGEGSSVRTTFRKGQLRRRRAGGRSARASPSGSSAPIVAAGDGLTIGRVSGLPGVAVIVSAAARGPVRLAGLGVVVARPGEPRRRRCRRSRRSRRDWSRVFVRPTVVQGAGSSPTPRNPNARKVATRHNASHELLSFLRPQVAPQGRQSIASMPKQKRFFGLSSG